jgi:hypothetical protein
LRRAKSLREKSKFASGINAESGVQSFAQKYCFSLFWKIVIVSPRPGPQEGRFAIVTSVGRGMRWTLAARAASAAEVDGEIVWSWRPWAGAKRVMIRS